MAVVVVVVVVMVVVVVGVQYKTVHLVIVEVFVKDVILDFSRMKARINVKEVVLHNSMVTQQVEDV